MTSFLSGEKVLGYRCVRRVATCHGRSGFPADSLHSLDNLANCTNETIVMQTDMLDNSTHAAEDRTCSKAAHGGACGMPTLDYCECVCNSFSLSAVRYIHQCFHV